MAESQSNALEVTVSELSGRLKRTVEETFGHVRVRGEISGYRGPHSSGHSYFSLKDDRARLEAVIWRGQAAKLKHLPEEGLEVIASGKLTTYPGSSKYQIVIDNLEPAGAGALMALLEERRRKLAGEGLFDETRKRALPFMPRVIGVITSPTGAVIRDILHRLSDRFPVHVLVWPIRVQGESSGNEAANGIHRFNQSSPHFPQPDLIIVARGGGSLEDLWGFNDEALVRAVAASEIPLISAVGHETDWTLIDHASDWRAPTPTAAAERAVPVRADLEAHLADLSARLRGATSRLFDRKRGDLRSAARGIRSADMLLAMPRRAFDEAAGRLARSLDAAVQSKRNQLARAQAGTSLRPLLERVRAMRTRFAATETRHHTTLRKAIEYKHQRFDGLSSRVRSDRLKSRLTQSGDALYRVSRAASQRFIDSTNRRKERFLRNERLLHTLSYNSTLERGFAVIRDASGTPVTTVSRLVKNTAFSVQMQDGRAQAIATGHEDKMEAATGKKASRTRKVDTQGDLF